MKILIVCKDIGAYVRKLSDFLSREHEVVFIDTADEAYKLSFIPRRMRGALKELLNLFSVRRKIASAGRFDVSLVVNPGQVSLDIIRCATESADKNIAYLYDSFSSKPVDKKILDVFDKVYTFDADDAKKYKLLKLYNYIYDEPRLRASNCKYKAFIVMSGRGRAGVLSLLADEFDRWGVRDYRFLLQSKEIPGLNKNLIFFRERMSLDLVAGFIEDSEILVDIERPGNRGLSFRFFEAMLYKKKIITTNKAVAEYDFFNPGNILIINPDHPEVPEHFLSGEYVDIPGDIFDKYTMRCWVQEVFGPI